MHTTPPDGSDGGGMISQARHLMAACGRYMSARAKLARLEGKEAGTHALKILLMVAMLVMLAAFMWLFLCIGAVSVLANAFLHHGWLWSSLIMAGAHLALIFLVAAALRRKAATPLFPLTTEELKKDQEWLEQQNQTKPPC